MVTLTDLNKLPKQIEQKTRETLDEVETIINKVVELQETKLESKVSIEYKDHASGDVLTTSERAQSICFVTRYKHLPIIGLKDINIQNRDGEYHLDNIGVIRHVLNEYRTIIQNQNDSIYFQRIHNFCYQKLKNDEPERGLSISVINEDKKDLTELFLNILGEKNKALNFIITNSEFGYIYNGILQHSDHDFTDRFLSDYNSGKLNYIFIKHALLLSIIKELLHKYFVLINNLTFPKLGSF